MNYRPEIDGLRALAVLPVIFFHAGFNSFSGGFVGVDVFFVISGYLITSILVKDLERNSFSIKDFYVRRVRRIFPALLFVLSVTYCISALIYLPAAHKVVGEYVTASVFAISNILLILKGNDYFGLEEGNNPLFITWSLGVEEQFYLVFPILLLIFWRFGKFKVICIFTLLFVSSLFLSEWGSRNFLSVNYFFTPGRAWELLAGSLSAFLLNSDYSYNKNNNTLSFLGLLLIIFSFFSFNNSTPFPSFYTLVPVVGSVLIILFSNNNTFVGRLLSNKILVGIGLISYSAYLWHLPLKVYIDYMFGFFTWKYYLYFSLLILLSYSSYRFIEKPFRQSINPRLSLIIIFILSLILSTFGVLGYLNGGFPDRSTFLRNLQTNNGWGNACNGNTDLVTPCFNSSTPMFAVLGNSYAMTWVKPLDQNINNRGLVQLTQDSCALGFVDKLVDVNSIPCDVFYNRAIKTILANASIKTVLISSPFIKETNDPIFLDSFINLIDQLNEKKIIVIGPTPKAPFNVGECILKNTLLYSADSCNFDVNPNHLKLVEKLKIILSGRPNVTFVDITNTICPSGNCLMSINSNKDSMYIDAGHLSLTGDRIVFDKLNLIFD